MTITISVLLPILTVLSALPISTASNVYFGGGLQLLATTPTAATGYSSLTSDGSFQSYEVGKCGCTTIPTQVPTICAEINYKGQRIDFYKSTDCSGSNVWDMGGSWPSTAWFTCGSFSYETNSVKITC